jgi:hypothetical protein
MFDNNEKKKKIGKAFYGCAINMLDLFFGECEKLCVLVNLEEISVF